MNGLKHKILLVDNEAEWVAQVADNLDLYGGYDVLCATDVSQALDHAKRHPTIRLVITDMMMDKYAPFDSREVRDGALTGLILIRRLQEILPDAQIIVTSRAPDQRVMEAAGRERSVIYAGFSLEWTEMQRKVDAALKGKQFEPEIFIVHGHDYAILNELQLFLIRDLELTRLRVLKDDEMRGNTIIEALEKHVSAADLIFILLTGDDVGNSRGKSRRARPNVIFEAGYCMGVKRRKSGRVILLYKGNLEIWSDIRGLTYIDVSQGIEAAGVKIRRELRWFLSPRSTAE